MDWFSFPMVIGGLVIGIVVGLTGMGGGALLTPMLVFFFHVPTLAAISSDVLISFVMKPFGGAVHAFRGTVNWRLVGYLCLGSVPGAFGGAWLISFFPVGETLDAILRVCLGVALLLASGGLIARAWLGVVQGRAALGEGPAKESRPQMRIRPVATTLLGLFGGVIVGVTSVGAGSLIIVVLLLLYPTLKASQLVGTDLVQAIPLVGSATLGHLVFGEVDFGVSGSILIGAIPGAVVGALISSRAPGGIIRRVLAILLMASGLALLGVPAPGLIAAAVAALVLGNIAWIVLRTQYHRRADAKLAAREATEEMTSARSRRPDA
ncbi:MAG: sulfite exporter TauE/SafE family protein [Microbacterium sp.]|nr:sulfite exporter TauE/SafE family protein [Microbacterium sp.]